MTTAVPIADNIFRTDGDVIVLLGSRCQDCGNHTFPVQQGCARCMSDRNETVELSTRGTLWTWTVQGFPPKAPPYLGAIDPFEPYGVGYVELPGEVKVEARLTESDPDRLEIGMAMTLVPEILGLDPETGEQVVTYAFAPVVATMNEED